MQLTVELRIVPDGTNWVILGRIPEVDRGFDFAINRLDGETEAQGLSRAAGLIDKPLVAQIVAGWQKRRKHTHVHLVDG
jgi:hypothetical protein